MRELLGVVAWDQNRAIGYRNDLPWLKLLADRKFFRELTVDHTVLMGRHTADSLPEQFRPLPKRRNIVLSRDEQYQLEGFEKVNSLDQLWLLLAPGEKVFSIGGAQVYELTLPFISTLYVTRVESVFPADTYFPPFDESEWRVVEETPHLRDDQNPYDLTFLTYVRKLAPKELYAP